MVIHERPGVYSDYDASSAVRVTPGGKVVGIAARSAGGDGTVKRLSSQGEAAAAFGADDPMTGLVRLLFLNGAAAVRAVGVKEAGGYAAALALLEAEEDVAVLVCDSADLSVQQAVRESVKAASAAMRERIGVVCGGAGESAAELAARAQALNSERMVLCAPCAAEGPAGAVAAAAAGAVAGERDPAVPLGGAELRGLGALERRFDEGELDVLIRGGVTPVERVAGMVSVVRGVTTRTRTGEAGDATWRELSTILIVDEVIPGVREALRAKFRRAKNTPQSRGAVRAQVVVELENRVSREVIGDYGEVSVEAKEDDPTVCLVEFNFSVVHGINQIWLTAHITV